MERSALLAIACCMGLATTSAAADRDSSWTLIRESENITVYTREVEGSRFVESLARTVIDVPLTALVALIMDGDRHSSWIDTIEESRRLEAVSETEVYIYTVSGAPWPIADRDAIVLSSAEQDEDTLVVTIRSSAAPDFVPERDGVVRVRHVESTWTLAPREDGRVDVSYRVHNDPGGELPSWLVNSLASDQPYNTLENLHRFFASDEAYRRAVLPYVEEPGS